MSTDSERGRLNVIMWLQHNVALFSGKLTNSMSISAMLCRFSFPFILRNGPSRIIREPRQVVFLSLQVTGFVHCTII